MALPKGLKEIRQIHVHVRSSADFIYAFGKGKFVVRARDKPVHWRLHSAVIGKLRHIYRYAQPFPLSYVLRGLELIPDRRTMEAIERILKGKSGEELKRAALHQAIADKYAEFRQHRAGIRQRLQNKETVWWHETA